MELLHYLRNAVANLFKRGRMNDDLEEELKHHLAMAEKSNLETGMSPTEARRAARVEFGGVEKFREECRDAWGTRLITNTFRDMRFSLRTLVKSPGFACISIITLTLGIGLNTAMFSLVSSMLLRPLPYPHADQLVTLFRSSPESRETGGFAPADFSDLKRAEAGFGRFAAFQRSSMQLDASGREWPWLRVSPDLFDIIGVQPNLGRLFRAEETMAEHRVVIISDGVWRDEFGRSPDVVGQTIRSNDEIYEIIGVFPATAIDHRVFGRAGLFTPLILDDHTNRSLRTLNIVGRRAPEISEAQGARFIEALGQRIAADFPLASEGGGWRSESLSRSTVNPNEKSMVFTLFVLSACVLAIACSNLANLFLARTMERIREFAVRTALGATRSQLIVPLTLESAVLAVVGGGGVLLVATWTTDWMDSIIQSRGEAAVGFVMDWRVLGFTAVATLLTLVFFSVVPALVAGRINVNHALKSGARSAPGGRGHQRFRNLLIVGQFAFAMILLSGAGFFVRGSGNLMQQPPGWSSDRVIQGKIVQMPTDSYDDDVALNAFYQRFEERLRALPGVESASLSHRLPYLGLRGDAWYVADPHAGENSGVGRRSQTNGVTPEYFSVTGTRLTAGRLFTEADTATSPKVAIVSESMARAVFGQSNPLGRRIAISDTDPREWWEIVGVVEDVRTVDPSDRPSSRQLYRPLTQAPRRDIVFGVRTHSMAPGATIESIRTILNELDPRLTVINLTTVDRAIVANTVDTYVGQRILTAFAALGLLLAALGIYGVIARLVAQRTQEFGIRLALGARLADLSRLVLGWGLRIALIGAIVGLLGGWQLSKLLSSAYPSMQTNSGLILAGAAIALVLIALVASWFPARRATKVNPLIALRAE